MGGRRRRHIAVGLMCGVTIVAAGSLGSQSATSTQLRRFLAVDNARGRSLITVVTDESTAIFDPSGLYSGLKVRIYGVQNGRTIHARRIELVH